MVYPANSRLELRRGAPVGRLARIGGGENTSLAFRSCPDLRGIAAAITGLTPPQASGFRVAG
jgi:hypothetical protein